VTVTCTLLAGTASEARWGVGGVHTPRPPGHGALLLDAPLPICRQRYNPQSKILRVLGIKHVSTVLLVGYCGYYCRHKHCPHTSTACLKARPWVTLSYFLPARSKCPIRFGLYQKKFEKQVTKKFMKAREQLSKIPRNFGSLLLVALRPSSLWA
jgi:hypothetical protein